MGGLRDFLIKFDKPQPVYFPGDVVSGQLVVNLSEQKSFKKIKVRLEPSRSEIDMKTL